MTQAQASTATANYRTLFPGQPKAQAFTATDLSALMGASGAVGIRFYEGVLSGTKVLIPVAYDSDGNDILPPSGQDFKSSFPCPTVCSGNNYLNS